jgi:2-keto-4-pentenoate hydratase
MALSKSQIQELADTLIKAAENVQPVEPLTETHPNISVDDAYRIQLEVVERRLSAGRRIVGKKIGLTSPAMQQMFGVGEPDYGHLFDNMVVYQGEAASLDGFLQPRIEGEIAFVLERDLKGPGVTPTDVQRATAGVVAAFEIVDSRIRDWKIKIQDTVADNASSGAFVLGAKMMPVDGLDLRHVGFVMNKNGALAATGAGAAVLGSPVQSVAWLANKMGEYDIGLKAGEIVLSGAPAAATPIVSGDSAHLTVDRIGDVTCYFK